MESREHSDVGTITSALHSSLDSWMPFAYPALVPLASHMLLDKTDSKISKKKISIENKAIIQYMLMTEHRL